MSPVDYDEWCPIYMEILQDFGYSQKEDIESARLLQQLRGSDGLSPLKELKGKKVEIQGPFMKEPYTDIQIPAGSALSVALKNGGEPYMIVTDLDGDTHTQLSINLDGVPAVIHAHGDNIDMVKRWGPRFLGHVVSTCQCEPLEKVYNFGGFTDGDRAVFIADHFQAKEIILNGWDFETPVKDGGVKKHKLQWAERLIDLVKTPVTYLG